MNHFTVFAAQYLVWAAPVVVVLVWLVQPKARRILFLRALAVGVLCAAFGKIASMAYMEHRPFVVHHASPSIPQVDDNSFPSNQTLFAFGCAFLLFPFSITASVSVGLIGLVVAWARVAALLHSPFDIIASVILAAVAALLAKVMIRRSPKTGEPGRRRLAKMRKNPIRFRNLPDIR